MVQLKRGESQEMLEGSARFLVSPYGSELGFEQALERYRQGEFRPTLEVASTGEFHDRRVWIALPFANAPSNAQLNAQSNDPPALRRVIGVGGIFVKLPRVYLVCEDAPPREILASKTAEGGPLSARYFTYVRSQSFLVEAGQTCLALINTASSDNPNIGLFREGELGTRQVVAVLVKGGFTATLLIIGVILATVSYLTSRPLGVLLGMTYSLTMIQNEASLFTTTFVPDPLYAREIWENVTLLAIFGMLNAFLFGFRKELRLQHWITRIAIAVGLVVPLVVIARNSNSTPDIIWAFYLSLFLFAVTVALRFPTGPKLRAFAGIILLLSAFAAVVIEPYYLGRNLSDLTIEWARDAIRLLAGLGMLLLLLVDVLQSRRERNRMMVERIDALETQAETDRRLLETEREYARAREAAARTKAQLAAASHDIRQPIVGLRAAVFSEAERLSPALQKRLREAIDYLELLTHEYSNRGANELQDPDDEAIETYPVVLVTQAVGSMFSDEAAESGIEFHVSGTDRRTSIPALALIRATSNLVANALRHAHASTIRVSIDDLDKHCLIHVEDDGCGMNPAELARAQTSGAKSDKSEGDGLGLAIVHDLAARHGFTFEIVSEPDRGTKATLTIPIECE